MPRRRTVSARATKIGPSASPRYAASVSVSHWSSFSRRTPS